MNILVDDIETIVRERIKIDFLIDFRISIMFELLMQDNEIDDNTKIIQAIKLYYPKTEQITDYAKALEDIMWFYSCGKEEKTSQKEENRKTEQIYSYEFDDQLIYSAFRDQYGIDLQKAKLNWWEFKAMFEGLKSDNKIVEIMGYRAVDLSKIKDKEERKRYKKLKQIYALPDMRTQEQKEQDFAMAFM